MVWKKAADQIPVCILCCVRSQEISVSHDCVGQYHQLTIFFQQPWLYVFRVMYCTHNYFVPSNYLSYSKMLLGKLPCMCLSVKVILNLWSSLFELCPRYSSLFFWNGSQAFLICVCYLWILISFFSVSLSGFIELTRAGIWCVQQVRCNLKFLHFIPECQNSGSECVPSSSFLLVNTGGQLD